MSNIVRKHARHQPLLTKHAAIRKHALPPPLAQTARIYKPYVHFFKKNYLVLHLCFKILNIGFVKECFLSQAGGPRHGNQAQDAPWRENLAQDAPRRENRKKIVPCKNSMKLQTLCSIF